MKKTKLISEWKDDFENKANIEEVFVKAHKDAKQEKAYRLSCYAEYNEDFCYYVSVFETVADAEQKLAEFSCGTFKNQLVVKANNIIKTLPSEYKKFFEDCEKSIIKIKNLTEINEEEKSIIINAYKRILKDYTDNLINYFVVCYDEAKILYDYVSKM